jgi:hypothetical protein
MAHKKLWHVMINISAVNLRHKKTYGVTKKSWISMQIYDSLVPNGKLCQHHMEDQLIINKKNQQYSH